MEFKARLLVNSQDPELAYNELRQALQYTGIEIRIGEHWLKNNYPLPKDSAQRIALQWQRNMDPISVDHHVQFETDNREVAFELAQLDLFSEGVDNHRERTVLDQREVDTALAIEGNVGVVPIKGELK